MEFKNGYKLIYEKADANGRKLYATKGTAPSVEDKAINLPNNISEAKFIYETADALKYNVNAAAPGDGDVAFLPIIDGEAVIAGTDYKNLALTISAIPGSTDLFGKTADELQANITVINDTISGLSHYVTDYTGFSSKPEEQKGNYLALHVDSNIAGATIVFNGKTDVTLGEDGDIVIILGENTSSVKFSATKDDLACSIQCAINVTKEEEPAGE